MKIDVVRPRDLGEPELSAWRRMRRASPHLASPWLAPEFAQAVSHVRDAARVAVICDDTGLAGFLPFEPCGPGAARPLAAWVTLAQGLVHRPGFEVTGPDLLKGCGLDVFEFEYLVGGQPWFTSDENRTAMLLDLESGYDGYIKFFRETSPKSYKTIVYKERKIQRDIGPLTYEYASDDHFGALLRWKSDQYRRIGRADRTAKPWVAALIERLRDVQTPEFSAPLSVLKIGDRPVAAHFGLVSEGVMAGWFPAYDPELGSYSPGLIHHLRLVEAAAARGLRHIDTGTAGEYKQTICNGTLPLSEGVARRPGAAAALHWARTAPARRIKKTIVGNPRLHALADRALRMRGRG
ncbi:GNAT family N-acetyltransferase [Herbidospora sp. NEAU-GS84]|uniref:GNAT family N-acetyltransferase n=1 Tax=Herbidospora solisilvae TaxID=2696284 RepID=A0A7C9P2D1_9ACTN|nr:GNAT family N-acetyltransferase [Herbidospora solisilvae]